MVDFDFYPFGTESITLKFDCDECGEPVVSEDIYVPSPNYGAERASDSQVEEEGYAICGGCNKEFQIDIFVTYAGASGNINNLPDDYHVEVEENGDSEEEELFWEIASTEQLKTFQNHLKSVNSLLDHPLEEQTEFSLFVMLYAHIVASTELFLSSVFIREVTNSDKLIRKLVESDPFFCDKSFKLNEIYKENEGLKTTVANYLKDLIFHKLDKIKPMYKTVLGFDFGNISWLFRAVLKRHDCVHRAGYDKEGNKITVTSDEIKELMNKCNELAQNIDLHVISHNTEGHE